MQSTTANHCLLTAFSAKTKCKGYWCYAKQDYAFLVDKTREEANKNFEYAMLLSKNKKDKKQLLN